MPETRPLHPPGKWLHHASIRWNLQRDDGEAIMGIESTLPRPWREEDVLTCLFREDVFSLAAEVGPWDDQCHGRVVGYCLYERDRRYKSLLHLIRLAVHPDARRHGVGRRLIWKVQAQLVDQRRRITADVHEQDLEVQLFLQAQGFLAVTSARNFYDDRDGIRFVYEQPEHP